MDRPTIRREADARAATGGPAAEFLPASRRDLVALGPAALGAGPVLVTGDAGVGKSWLVGRWAGSIGACRWVRIDLTPDDPPALLHRLIARGMGLAVNPAAPPTRCEVTEALAERALDGDRFGLIVDEAHNLGPSLWEEVRVLLNRLGQEDGFAHLALVGQTPLVRRLAARSLGSVETRLAAHVHLRPLDLGDTRAWLAEANPARTWSDAEVETIHRDTGGNPARLIRLLSAPTLKARAAASPVLTAPLPTASPMASMPIPPAAPALAAEPLTGPARPPLHVADDSIEVGWSGDDADAPESSDDPIRPLAAVDDGPSLDAVRLDETDQAVHDHYAALQAWREWADNQARRPGSPSAARTDRELAEEIDLAAEAEAAEFFGEGSPGRGPIRTESHGSEPFAPFGALFARMPRGVDAGPPRS